MALIGLICLLIMINTIRESLRNICERLNKFNVEYILIGGVAVGFHGFPRSTADIDFWYNPTISNFNKIISALDSLNIDTTSLRDLVFDPKKTFLSLAFVPSSCLIFQVQNHFLIAS